MKIELQDISKRFGSFAALRGISLDIRPGELVALLGPSGSGKTLLLRIVAGLQQPDSGRVLFDGKDVGDQSARQRNIGFVFQHYALFRHMTVAANIAFGLQVKPMRSRPSRRTIDERVAELLRIVQLDGLGNRFPSQLSGGQRQRVALARALATRPQLLLLDEPFGALDAKVRKELRRWLRQLHDSMGLSSIFVTHDQEEALELADRVAVMNQGLVDQVGSPLEIHDCPATPFICEFLGDANRIHGELRDRHIEIGNDRMPVPGTKSIADGPVTAFVRRQELAIELANGSETLAATIRHRVVTGSSIRIELTLRDSQQPIEVELQRDSIDITELNPGRHVGLRARRLVMFPERAAGPS